MQESCNEHAFFKGLEQHAMIVSYIYLSSLIQIIHMTT